MKSQRSRSKKSKKSFSIERFGPNVVKHHVRNLPLTGTSWNARKGQITVNDSVDKGFIAFNWQKLCFLQMKPYNEPRLDEVFEISFPVIY